MKIGFIFTAAGACVINDEVDDCVSTVRLTGDCLYKSKNTDNCKFRVILHDHLDEPNARIRFTGLLKSGEKRERVLIPGDKYEGCAKFGLGSDSGSLTIQETICECPGHENAPP